MRNIFRFSFERESYWLLGIAMVVSLLAILVSIVLPGVWHRAVSDSPTQPPRPSSTSEPPRAAPCIRAGDLPSPPRKIRNSKADVSGIRDRTHAGVLVFDATITPSGKVTSVRLAIAVDSRPPWPTLIDRWRSAISDWRYEPVTVNNVPVAVCMTVTVNVHVK